MINSRRIVLGEVLEEFIAEHAVDITRLDKNGDPARVASILASGGAADVPYADRRDLARPADLFLDLLRRRGFRVVDDYMTGGG